MELLDAIKAARGGLDGVRFESRMGIHTGAAVVGNSEHAGRSMTFGEAINVASRVQAAGSPGTVTISGATLPLLRRKFVTSDLGMATLKGVAEPVQLFGVLRLAQPMARPGPASVGLRMVGRGAQLEQLVAR